MTPTRTIRGEPTRPRRQAARSRRRPARSRSTGRPPKSPAAGAAAPGPAAHGEHREAGPPAGGRSHAAVLLALAGLVAVAYHRVLFLGETFVERDALRFALPSRQFLAAALRAGRIPEWLDGVGLGAPFAGNPVHEVLAPLGWALALAPTSFGFDLYNLVHLLIGGLGAAALARRLGAGTAGCVVAGAALALGGYASSMVPNNLAPALAWTPWVAWAADRLAAWLGAKPAAAPAAAAGTRLRRALAGAAQAAPLLAALAAQLLAGEPASVLIAGATAAIFVVARTGRPLRSLGALLGAAGGALLLAAVAILPALLVLRESARGAGLDQGGLEWSLHPARLVETVWPAAFGSQRVDGWLAGLLLREGPGDPCWSFSLFLGLPVLLSAGVAARERTVRRLLLASAAFLLVAAGPITPLYALLRKLFPPLSWVNFPEKFVYGALLLWTAAAGAGFSRLVGEPPAAAGNPALQPAGAAAGDSRPAAGGSRRVRAVAFVAAALLVLGTSLLALLRAGLASTLARRAADWGALVNTEAGLTAALQGGCVAAVAACLFAFGLALGRRAPRAASARLTLALTLLATLGPLAWAAATTTPLARRATISRTPAVLRGLAPAAVAAGRSGAFRPRLFRLEPRRENGPFANGDEIARDYHESLDTNIASRFGFDVLPGFEPGQSARYLRFGREVFPRLSAVAFARLLGVEWLVVRDPEALGLPFPVVARGEGGSALLAAGPVRPRAFVAPRWRAAATAEEALAALAAPGREDDPATVTLIDPPPGRMDARAPLSPCVARQPRPEEVRIDCDSPAGGYAVLLDEWAPGWEATADGRPAAILLADGLFRAVAIGPGPHRIVFSFRTPGLRAGAAVSLVAWLALGALALFQVPAARAAATTPARWRQPASRSDTRPVDG
jgi:Bacterial membrane protein YfhO